MKPILFNTEMVRAILDGRKTVTRRVIKDIDRYLNCDCGSGFHSGIAVAQNMFFCKECEYPLMADGAQFLKSRYKKGDTLYVRETWQMVSDPEWQLDNNPCSELIRNWDSITKIETYNNGHEGKGYYVFKADSLECSIDDCLNWCPSIHMPKEAARLFLRVTDVRVEKLQDMNLDDFLSEGVGLLPEAFNDPDNAYGQARSRFSGVWDSAIKKSTLPLYGWKANPWVWAIKFERCERP